MGIIPLLITLVNTIVDNSDQVLYIAFGGIPMTEVLEMLAVRVPSAIRERARRLAESQERSLQTVVTRALELGLDRVEEQERIAAEAIKTAEGRRPVGAAAETKA